MYKISYRSDIKAHEEYNQYFIISVIGVGI